MFCFVAAEQNTPRWPPVLKRRQSFTSAPASYFGSRMLRSATTSFEILRQNSASNMMPNDVVRLMAAISMGYGAFNLMVSLLPPTFVSVIGMFGFSGNRQTGLDALAFAKNGLDVRAPLAWGILSWYRMIGNTDFLFDGPRSREDEPCVCESEQLVLNPPKEFRNSTSLQYFTGRSCYLKGDLDGAIRAYEAGSTIDEDGLVNMKTMYSHELGFMYAIRLDWTAACRQFASIAGDTFWMRPFHYVMASDCQETEDGDNDTIQCTKKFLTIVCRRALQGCVDIGHHRDCLVEYVEHLERDKRRDHLYAYGLYELAAELINSTESVDEIKLTIQKLNNLKGPYHFQYFYEMRCASLLAYVQRLNTR